MQTGAIFSNCRKYRYALWRIWDHEQEQVLFIGLNPSAADETHNDPTIRRCIDFAQRWGFGGMYITNLFAYRHKSPAVLKKVKRPIGKENDYYLQKYAAQCTKVVLIWGNDGAFRDRNLEVLELIKNPLCLKINKSGQPAHPLYLKKNLNPRPYVFDAKSS